MPNFKKLRGSYNKLASNEKLILQVISVIYEPVNQTQLNKVLVGLYRINAHFHSLDLSVNKRLKDRFEASNLVTVKSGKLG